MKFVIQRVNHAKVTVEGEVTGSIGKGYLVFMGVGQQDTRELADKMLQKLVKLRIFSDEEGKINRSVSDVGGELLFVSQFTLYADCRKGNRPSFFQAGKPEEANALYEYVVGEAEKLGFSVGTGAFGAHMKVELENDGPFTVVLDSAEIFPNQ